MFHTKSQCKFALCCVYIKRLFLICRENQPLRFGKDFEKYFDVQQYLHERYTVFNPVRCFPLRELHKLCAELKAGPKNLSVLDIGSGPNIANFISVAPYTSKIVSAEYATPNRAALTAWLENQEDAFDWKPYFKMVVTEMEGKDEREVERRETLVEKRSKLWCHVTSPKTLLFLKSTCASMTSSKPYSA